MGVKFMVEYNYRSNGNVETLFHANLAKFNRDVKFNYKGKHYLLKVNRNDAVYDVLKSEVTSWKTLENGKQVPENFELKRDLYYFNRVVGNPYSIACNRIMAGIDVELLEEEY